MTKILFVDDDPNTQEILARATLLLGQQGVAAFSGHEALAMMEKQQPDLIFVDIQLADMNGLDLVRMLRGRPDTQKTPIVVLSASAEMDVPAAARAAGANEFVDKPIRLQALEDIIRRYTAE